MLFSCTNVTSVCITGCVFLCACLCVFMYRCGLPSGLVNQGSDLRQVPVQRFSQHAQWLYPLHQTLRTMLCHLQLMLSLIGWAQRKQQVLNSIKLLPLSNLIKAKDRPAEWVCISSLLVSLTVWLVLSTKEEESCSWSLSVYSRCSATCRPECATTAWSWACCRVAEESGGKR